MYKSIFILLLAGLLHSLNTFSQPPNIVFIYADDWGYGDLSCHGHEIITTPNLDKLAAEGTEFLQFNVNNPVCSPSRTALMTGHYPARHHVHQHFAHHDLNMERNMPDWLDPEVTMLPRLLKNAGYKTAHYGKWHLTNSGVYEAPLPVVYGYDETYVFNGPGSQVGVPIGVSTGKCVDYSIDFIEKNKNNPFFINLWIHESHTVIDPPQDAKNEYLHVEEPFRSYYACISYADRELGRLFQYLKDEGLESNTLVIFSSDNGPENPHDDPERITYYSRGETAGLVGRKRSLFEGGVGVPFIVHWPGRVPSGKKNNTTHIAAVDMLPTLIKIAGISLPSGYQSDGEDLSEAILGNDIKRSKPLFWEWQGTAWGDNWPRGAVRSGDWKLLSNEDGSQLDLYNIQSNRIENSDSAEFYPNIADSLFQKLNDWRQELPKNIPFNSLTFSTNKKGDRVEIIFNDQDTKLTRVVEPVFKIYRSESMIEIPVEGYYYIDDRISLELDTSYHLTPSDELHIGYMSGEIKNSKGEELLYFSTEPVVNMISDKPELYSLEFNFFDADNGRRLEGVSVSGNSVELNTNSNGAVFFHLESGNYEFYAEAENYKSYSEELSIESDSVVNVYLHSTIADILFRIKSGSSFVYQACVEIDKKKVCTNSVGLAVYEDLPVDQGFMYIISKDGYVSLSDSLFLVKDTIVSVDLELSPLGLSKTDDKFLKVFPNPAKDHISVISGRKYSHFEIFNNRGEGLMRKPVDTPILRLNISRLQPGIYYLKLYPVEDGNKPVIRKILVY